MMTMNLQQIKANKPVDATHYCKRQQLYIHIDNGSFYHLDGDWIQYDDSCRMDLVEL